MGLMFGQNKSWIAKFVRNEVQKFTKRMVIFRVFVQQHKADLLNKLKNFGTVNSTQNKETLHGKIHDTIT